MMQLWFREYYPQNIMFDKRVHRGNSYAAMVIPAGTNHDTMVMEKKENQKRTFRGSNNQTKKVNIYPNRDMPSPEPELGKRHLYIQIEPYTLNTIFNTYFESSRATPG